MEFSRGYISSTDVVSKLSLRTWWGLLLVLPLSVKLTRFIVNRTSWSPNTITVVGIGLRLSTAALFLWATPLSLIIGALTYIAAYVCDCTDGTVARLTGKTSEFGRYLDHVADLLGDILILLVLASAQNLISMPWIWAMVFMHVVECYISYMTGFALKQHHGEMGNFVLFRWFNLYRQWWFRRNLKSFLSFSDYTALVFVLFPLLGLPALGLIIGFWLLLVVVLYTVLSTFVSLHTSVKQFP
ncbi:CDP-alcohol phosphatidyltransferase [Desulfuromusa kysingii]|uniref:CDP-alcohol phosphatidyltransferase n=1 Tax=Desulfuromusa kysingii TaxID=37625 RepID=A0A1H4CXE1_9BACT|nr:CDP-alcohol phosphatidyltransferase family protein [Desulfuromusa kysingii]SEA65028.1 CDP-alcohol phosphatidyltransferase [Desulfuromusa kysingii]